MPGRQLLRQHILYRCLGVAAGDSCLQRVVPGVQDDQPGSVPLRVGKRGGDRRRVDRGILKAKQHRPDREGRVELPANYGHGAARGTADRRRDRPDQHLAEPFSESPNYQEVGIVGAVQECAYRLLALGQGRPPRRSGRGA
ncbi:MAG TPA: hypothetical protein VNP92_09440 [Actinophytocola sp.]|nr:hypothetical protein [Actinophytocola sp.]